MLSLFSWPGYAWWFIAKEKKFAPEIDFEISIIENPLDSMSMLASGQMDIVSSTIEYGPIALEKGRTDPGGRADNHMPRLRQHILAPGITSAEGVRGGQVHCCRRRAFANLCGMVAETERRRHR